MGAELVWAFAAFGARVAAVRVYDGPLLLADDRPAASCMPVLAVKDLKADGAGPEEAGLAERRGRLPGLEFAVVTLPSTAGAMRAGYAPMLDHLTTCSV
jgi:hypothetical protein